MTIRTLPRPEAPIVDERGRPTAEWWRFFNDLQLTEAEVAELRAAIEASPETESARIQGPLSVLVSGTLDSGLVQLKLDGDQSLPGALKVYGTSGQGSKGWLDFPFSPYLVFVKSKDDLPAAIGGIINLPAGYSYFVVAPIDLTGDRLVCEGIVSIFGTSSETASITSTGLSGSVPLLTSEYSLPLKFITFTSGTALHLDATANANQALDWLGVNFLNCQTVGIIKNYNNFIASDCAWLSSANMTFDGTIGTVGFQQCLFVGVENETTIIFPSTYVASRRARAIYSAFVSLTGGTAIDFSASATVPAEGYILDTISFTGPGTYLSGVDYLDNKALFTNCTGIINSTAEASVYMNANATATVIGATGTFYKIAGTSLTAPDPQKFDTSVSNRLTYTGSITRQFFVLLTVSLSAGSAQELRLRIAKNGTTLAPSQSRFETTVTALGRAFCVTSQAVVTLAPGDYVEPFVANDTMASNVTADDLTMTVVRVF